MSSETSHNHFRLQVTCDGIASQSCAQETVYQTALGALEPHKGTIRLASIRVERAKGHGHVCHVQLFGHGLDHVGARSEHEVLEDAVNSAVKRALRSMEAQERFDPWTSVPPSSHVGR